MNLAFNPNADPQGILELVGSTLRQIHTDDKRNIFLLGIASLDVGAFTEEDLEIVAPFHVLAVYFYQEQFDVNHFYELSPVQKLFCEGIEDQLARKIAYVGCASGPREILWLEVPPERRDWWPSKSLEERMGIDVLDKAIADISSDESLKESANGLE